MRTILFFALLLVATPAFGQMDFRDEVNSSIEIAEGKVIGLAEAFNEDQYAWRPGDGVRSVEEVVRHIAGTNYWMMSQMACTIPAETGITTQYQTVDVYETGKDRATAIEDLKASFDHLKECVSAVTDDQLAADMNLFGTPGTGQGYLMLTNTHLHEHLGQFVAYARVIGVVPPWSS